VRRRLLIAIVGTVAIGILVASFVALVGVRAAELDRTKSNLVGYARQFSQSDQSRTQRGLASVQSALGLETAAIQRFPIPGTQPNDPTEQIGMTAAITPTEVGTSLSLQAGGATLLVTDRILPRDLRSVAKGRSVTGIFGDRVYAVVKQSQSATDVDALLLITPFRYSPARSIVALSLAALTALGFASAIAMVFARRLSRPLIAATAAYRRIANGDLSVRVASRDKDAQRNDEIGELMRSLDVMADSLDRAQKQEQQFLLSVSHDLRTPLTSIRGFAEAIADGIAPEDQQRAAEVIASESRRLERLVRDLLEMAKLDANQFELKPRRCDLTNLVTDAADGFLPAAERENLALELSADSECSAFVDPERLGQVLANLIENAIKFARQTVRVSLTTRGTTTEPVVYRLTVSDDGPGIDPEDLPHVFDRLYTSDRRPTRQIGSGLGLTIVKELLDAMGATISVETSPNGTTFTVDLPVQPATTTHTAT
jgi:two-component system, OmpR family, sensor kinase